MLTYLAPAENHDIPAHSCRRKKLLDTSRRVSYLRAMNEPDTTYQGWKNHSTWAVALWVNNECGLYDHRRALALDAIEEAKRGEREARGILADMLKDWIEEEAPDLGATLWADLLTSALGQVDWYELAEHWLADEGG